MSALIRNVDLIAYDQSGQPILLAEVKSTLQTSIEWAARFRRNLLAHGTLPTTPFFLIATPEHMYFWKQEELAAMDAPPRLTIDAVSELKPYFERFKQTPGKTHAQALELIVFSWLLDQTHPEDGRSYDDPAHQWLRQSGLLKALKGARIEASALQ